MRCAGGECDDRPCRTRVISWYSRFIILESCPTACVAPWGYAPSGVLVCLDRLDNHHDPGVCAGGGTRQRHFAGTNSKPRKLPDCPQGVRRLPPPHLHWRAVPVWPRRSLSGIGCIIIPMLLRDAVLGGTAGTPKLYLYCSI